jgi:hypothetical protein
MTIERNAWYRDPSSGTYLMLLVGLPLVAIVVCVMHVAFSVPMPDYWRDARELVQTGRISQHFEPSGYATLIAIGME